MTRFLSESLGLTDASFHHGLRQLEAAHGNLSADIRLSSEVSRATKEKITILGLDPHDTNGKELYHSLLERMRQDDYQLVKSLRTLAATHISAEGDVVSGMVYALRQIPASKSCFAIKSCSFKSMIKKCPPKKVMKQLGYRSLESLLKHESAITIMAASKLTESNSWNQHLLEQYKKLKPNDFENREIAIYQPDNAHWRLLAENAVAKNKHNILAFPELGAVVLLPLPKDTPCGTTTASIALALEAMNEIRASSTFMKMSLMRSDFGNIVRTVASSETQHSTKLLDHSVPWQVIQRYYARMQHLFRNELFEPHIQLDDMSWPAVEEMLSHINPALNFWHNSTALASLHDHHPVSLNIVDVALNLCNQVPFEKRIAQHFQHSLWHELLLRYLKHDNVEQTVLAQLQPKLAAELVTA